MRKGEVVDIFEDPVSCLRREGRAKLIKLIRKDEDREFWEVHFLTDPSGDTYQRWI